MGFFLVFVPIIGMHLVHKYRWEHWEPLRGSTNESSYTSRMFFTTHHIIIVMKLAVWVEAVNAEQDYVKQEPFRKRGPFVENPYEDIDAEEEEYGDRTDYR